MDDLDALLSEAVASIPVRPRGKHPGSGTDSATLIAGARSAYEQETRFIRFAAWYTIERCACGHAFEPRFDGLFEERQWLRRPGTDWRRITWLPLKELMKGAVRHTRTFDIPFCPSCIPELQQWPEHEADTTFVWSGK